MGRTRDGIVLRRTRAADGEPRPRRRGSPAAIPLDIPAAGGHSLPRPARDDDIDKVVGMELGERPIGGRVVTPPPTRPKARVEPPADPPARRAARPAERCTAEALEGLARLPEDVPARGTGPRGEAAFPTDRPLSAGQSPTTSGSSPASRRHSGA